MVHWHKLHQTPIFHRLPDLVCPNIGQLLLASGAGLLPKLRLASTARLRPKLNQNRCRQLSRPLVIELQISGSALWGFKGCGCWGGVVALWGLTLQSTTVSFWLLLRLVGVGFMTVLVVKIEIHEELGESRPVPRKRGPGPTTHSHATRHSPILSPQNPIGADIQTIEPRAPRCDASMLQALHTGVIFAAFFAPLCVIPNFEAGPGRRKIKRCEKRCFRSHTGHGCRSSWLRVRPCHNQPPPSPPTAGERTGGAPPYPNQLKPLARWIPRYGACFLKNDPYIISPLSRT